MTGERFRSVPGTQQCGHLRTGATVGRPNSRTECQYHAVRCAFVNRFPCAAGQRKLSPGDPSCPVSWRAAWSSGVLTYEYHVIYTRLPCTISDCSLHDHVTRFFQGRSESGFGVCENTRRLPPEAQVFSLEGSVLPTVAVRPGLCRTDRIPHLPPACPVRKYLRLCSVVCECSRADSTVSLPFAVTLGVGGHVAVHWDLQSLASQTSPW